MGDGSGKEGGKDPGRREEGSERGEGKGIHCTNDN